MADSNYPTPHASESSAPDDSATDSLQSSASGQRLSRRFSVFPPGRARSLSPDTRGRSPSTAPFSSPRSQSRQVPKWIGQRLTTVERIQARYGVQTNDAVAQGELVLAVPSSPQASTAQAPVPLPPLPISPSVPVQRAIAVSQQQQRPNPNPALSSATPPPQPSPHSSSSEGESSGPPPSMPFAQARQIPGARRGGDLGPQGMSKEANAARPQSIKQSIGPTDSRAMASSSASARRQSPPTASLRVSRKQVPLPPPSTLQPRSFDASSTHASFDISRDSGVAPNPEFAHTGNAFDGLNEKGSSPSPPSPSSPQSQSNKRLTSPAIAPQATSVPATSVSTTSQPLTLDQRPPVSSKLSEIVQHSESNEPKGRGPHDNPQGFNPGVTPSTLEMSSGNSEVSAVSQPSSPGVLSAQASKPSMPLIQRQEAIPESTDRLAMEDTTNGITLEASVANTPAIVPLSTDTVVVQAKPSQTPDAVSSGTSKELPEHPLSSSASLSALPLGTSPAVRTKSVEASSGQGEAIRASRRQTIVHERFQSNPYSEPHSDTHSETQPLVQAKSLPSKSGALTQRTQGFKGETSASSQQGGMDRMAIAPERPTDRVDSQPMIWRKPMGLTTGSPTIRTAHGLQALSSQTSVAQGITPWVGQGGAIARQPDSTTSGSSSMASSSPTASPDPSSPPAPLPRINVGQIAEQVSRILSRQMTIERERRGINQWY
ncbi:MAG: hypothetical protein AAGD25_27865 [Cyanobacteria bacterium P01_F01_bin.150]